MFTINQQQLDDMLLGATALATGGGCLYETKKTLCQRFGGWNKHILEVSDIQPNDTLCTVYAVGSTSTQEANLEQMLRIGCRAVEKKLRRSLTAFFVGELGAEHLAIAAATICGVHLVDADGTGGRAVPEIVQDQFALVERKTTPAIIVTKDGNSEILEDMEPYEMERRVREIAVNTNGLVLVFDHLMKGREIFLLSCGNLKRSLTIGRLLREREVVSLPSQGLSLIDEACVEAINAQPHADFFRADVRLSGRKGTYQLLIQNENLVLLRNGEAIVTCPHLIILLDQDLQPVHNACIDTFIGSTVTIACARATLPWQTPRGYELFSPRRFGFEYEVVYRPT